jgi:cellulose synthase/poly-beta-1,6-N-acetylglucosamine synthase-like glycosyltransferase
MLVIEILLLIYFGYVSCYSFLLSVAALFFNTPRRIDPAPAKRFAVLIPSYREDNVIIHVAEEALRQNYDQENYDVVVIADSLKPTTVASLKRLPVKVVEVSFETSTKVKSLNRAMESIGDNYDVALILDADNIMERDFLKKINGMLAGGCVAIQAERTSKNSTTSMSVLDGFSERINNFIYRQGHVAAGLPCSLIGSGMVFNYGLVKNILSRLDSIGGFDRELELELIRRNIRICYGKGALVFDEKVESTEVFEKQRKRWLSSQFIYLAKYYREGIRAFFRGDFPMFNSAILKNIQLPRLINIGLLSLISVLTIFFGDSLAFRFYPWVIFLTMNILAMAFAIPLKYYNWQMVKSILLLPKVFIRMISLLFRLRGANKTFIHTPHRVTNVTINDKK